MIVRTLLIAIAIASAAPAGAALAQAPKAAPAAAARLNPHTATARQLAAVPGLTPAQAALIAARRPFKTMGEFHAVVGQGLPEAQRQALYARLFVPLNLNTASREDIMLIPGMTRRMAHEFEEYRPYRNLEQFNREIGKYVDAAEVARLRSYVTLN
jgi:DNA uptake protein ComE-like DNA-binding protein